MIVTTYRVACDCCDFVSREFPTPLALDVYLLGDHEPDGKWLVTRRRRICAGCIIDRACRIFGHNLVADDWCGRCQNPILSGVSK